MVRTCVSGLNTAVYGGDVCVESSFPVLLVAVIW
ncbi:hypothetical protein T05_5752 [Trichinella murrelli]|uniref:Uncharacterized protein n=1 Tax=Trichinella murrelli TaxID=144512 RepID=A0A0V0SW10_9BILA|nr:hypothetical protein T05_5752 [Trichinella murrelli]